MVVEDSTRRAEKKTRLPLVDRLPEHVHYTDSGCSVSVSCLHCPLERCIYDEPEGGRHASQRSRDEAIYRLYREHGPDIRSLAVRFGVSRRTIHRVVQRMRKEPS